MIRLTGVLVALLAPLCSSDSIAGESHLVLNGRSYHVGSSYDWNESNLGLGFEYQFEQTSPWRKTVMANAFRDSTNVMSYMAGAGLSRRVFETARWNGFYVYGGLNAFLMTRDDVNDSSPFPGILPSLTIGNRAVGMNVTYLPRQAVEEVTNSRVVDPTISGIVFLQFKVNLSQLMQ
jgi:hypothetical protein